MAWPINLPLHTKFSLRYSYTREFEYNNVKLVIYSTEPTLILFLFRVSYIESEYQYRISIHR